MAAVPSLREKFGIGPGSAAEIMIVAGDNLQRVRSEVAFAEVWRMPNSGVVGFSMLRDSARAWINETEIEVARRIGTRNRNRRSVGLPAW